MMIVILALLICDGISSAEGSAHRVTIDVSFRCQCKKMCEDLPDETKKLVLSGTNNTDGVSLDGKKFFCSQPVCFKGACSDTNDRSAEALVAFEGTCCSSSADCADWQYCVYKDDAEFGNCTNFDEGNVKSCGKDDDGMYPTDAFTCKQKKHGAVILHCLGVLYIFITLAIVCDDYFVPALEVLIEKYSITDDVAGATFMAAGGSAPELFTSIVGVFLARSDVGFGTIIGSAVFNVLLVIGACSVAAGRPLALTWWPLARDSIWYMISILTLYLLVNNDNNGQIDIKPKDAARMNAGLLQNPLTCIVWWEAVVMLTIYAGYVTFMANNERIESFVKGRLLKKKITPETNSSELENGVANGDKGMTFAEDVEKTKSAPPVLEHDGFAAKGELDGRRASADGMAAAAKGGGTEGGSGDEKHGDEKPEKDEPKLNGVGGGGAEGDGGGEGEDEDEEDALPWNQMPDGLKDRLNWVLFLPVNFLFAFTIPDCRNEAMHKWFWISFVNSILWIAAYSYLMVWWATEVCYTLDMPITVMGLTVLAAGTSVPDLITSVIVAKKGHGDMAVSSSIGSNIFDLTMGLPLPWVVSNVIVEPIKDSKFGKSYTLISSDNSAFFLSMLFGLLGVTVISIICFKWKISKPMGLFCLIMYVIFITLALAAEYGVIDVRIEKNDKVC